MMLLELEMDLPLNVIISLIIVGLRYQVQDSMNRENITSVQILHNKLKKFEPGNKDPQSKSQFQKFKSDRTQYSKFSKKDSKSKFYDRKNNINVNKKPRSFVQRRVFKFETIHKINVVIKQEYLLILLRLNLISVVMNQKMCNKATN